MTTSHVLASALILCAAAAANSDPRDLRVDDAVQIVFPTDLRADVNWPGDRFYVTVDKDPALPKGTRLYGRIEQVYPASYRRAAGMKLEFFSLETPNGDRWSIDAIPAPENDPHLVRGSNGRIIAQSKPGDEGAYTFGGAVGGLIVGGAVHRPITGTIIGAIIGSIAGHENRRQNANLVVKKGEHMVAVFERDVADQPPSRPGDGPPSGWRHGG